MITILERMTSSSKGTHKTYEAITILRSLDRNSLFSSGVPTVTRKQFSSNGCEPCKFLIRIFFFINSLYTYPLLD